MIVPSQEHFVGFFSYAQLPDRVDQRLLNGKFELWRDDRKLRTGETWDDKIQQAILDACVFVVLLTPKWLTSEYCCKEFNLFCSKSRKAMIPIQHIEIDLAHANAQQRAICDALAKLQYKKAHLLDLLAMTEPEKKRLVVELAKDIVEILKTARNDTPLPSSLVLIPFPAKPDMIGRATESQRLKDALLMGKRPIVVPGGPGMGKSTLALAVAHDLEVMARFPRRVFVALDGVTDSVGLLAATARHFGLPASGSVDDLLDAIAGVGPALAILDNFETPFASDRGGTAEMLGRLATLENLGLVVTVRGECPSLGPLGLVLPSLDEMDGATAKTLFLLHAGEKFAGDPALEPLLNALKGHPLSIILTAHQA